SEEQVEELFKALRQLDEDLTFLFTMPNADTDGRVIMQMIENFVEEMAGRAFSSLSLGQRNYFSAMKHCAAVVGNSSSGLLEAPVLRVPTVNIGDRQKGRLMAESVISCEPDVTSISKALRIATSPEFKSNLEGVYSPYGEGGASDRIAEILRKVDLNPSLLKKRFYDLPAAKC
ncbi:UDP-N-acetylglucosamine 2-epimerase, partial [Akkermansiaceae bacterium]|nr:UDP-N-acetylglucosamine 2-epimerase [Akkermansiaceae bacterium]